MLQADRSLQCCKSPLHEISSLDLSVEGGEKPCIVCPSVIRTRKTRLLEDFGISTVIIHNRYCRNQNDKPRCFSRLTNAVMSLIDNTGTSVSSIQLLVVST
jgi:3-oxoacyl-[acyl-carrier-protein] synthase III